MRKSIVFGPILALGLIGPALAKDGFNYSYVQADYLNSSYDVGGPNVDGDGFALRGSLAFTDMIHGYLDYSNQDVEGLSFSTWELGVGGNWTLTPAIDFYGRVGYTKWDLDLVDDTGVALQAGIRGHVAPQFELEGGIHYVDFSDFDSHTFLRGEGRYSFTDQFSAGVGVEMDSDITLWTIHARYNFAKK